MVGAKTVYMMFGQNDLDMGNDSVERYCALIGKIKEQSPDAEFVIMSMTYTLAGKGKGPINNDNIRCTQSRDTGSVNKRSSNKIRLPLCSYC